MIKLSVIIPTYNRLEALNNCLKALYNQQNVFESWQVVIVNDGGEEIESVVAEHQDKINIIHATQKNSGPAAARNLGVKISEGEIVAFLDDDCLPESDWVSEIISSSKTGEISGGLVTNLFSSNLYSESSQLLIDFLYGYNSNTDNEFFTSNNFSLYKKDFLKTKGFSTSFKTSAGEDREFCVRAKKMGLKLCLNESIRIKHAHYLTLSSFYRLHKKYGAAAYEYQLSMDEQNINVTKTPKLIFYFQMLKFPLNFSKYNLFEKIRIDLLLILSQIAVAMGYFLYRFKLIRLK